MLSNGKRSFPPLTNFRQLCQLNEYQDVARADDNYAFPLEHLPSHEMKE